MTRWMIVVNGDPIAYYEDQWEANRDAQHLRHTFRGNGDTIEVQQMTYKGWI